QEFVLTITEPPCPDGTPPRPTFRRERAPPRSSTRETVFPTQSVEARTDFHTDGRTPAGTPGAQGTSRTEGSVRQSGWGRAERQQLRIPGGRDGGGGGGGPGPWWGGNASGWTEKRL